MTSRDRHGKAGHEGERFHWDFVSVALVVLVVVLLAWLTSEIWLPHGSIE